MLRRNTDFECGICPTVEFANGSLDESIPVRGCDVRKNALTCQNGQAQVLTVRLRGRQRERLDDIDCVPEQVVFSFSFDPYVEQLRIDTS